MLKKTKSIISLSAAIFIFLGVLVTGMYDFSYAEAPSCTAPVMTSDIYPTPFPTSFRTETRVTVDALNAMPSLEGADVNGYTLLGYSYLKNMSQGDSLSKARKWFELAAEQDDAIGQAFLGWIYQYGLGIDVDISQAIKWYEVAALHHNQSAIKNLTTLKNQDIYHGILPSPTPTTSPLPQNANAEDFTYRMQSDGTYTIKAYNGKARNVEVPAEYNKCQVTAIDDFVFYENKFVTSIKLPDTISTIGSYAFANCLNLSSIELPDSILSLGERAFANCPKLSKIQLPSSIEKLSSETFSECTSLQEIILPTKLQIIEQRVFYNCSALNKIALPDTVTSLGQLAFYGCSSLTEIVLSNSIQKLEDALFMNCTSLEFIKMPDSLIILEDQVFYGCSSLKEIEIPPFVTKLGDQTFCNCSSLATITLPEGLDTIGVSAFSSCSSLKSIQIPDSVRNIGDTAFFNCIALKQIVLPKGLTTISENLFSNCTSLTSIVIPDSVETIEARAFEYCKSLNTIVLPRSVKKIQEFAFLWCEALQEISIPEGISVIEKSTFHGCTKLAKITFPETLTTIKEEAFSFCSSLHTLDFPDSLCFIGEEAFANTMLRNTVLPVSLINIANNAFDPNNNTLVVYSDSYAEKYAHQHSFSCRVLGISATEKYPWIDTQVAFDPNQLNLKVNIINESHAQIALFDPLLKENYPYNSQEDREQNFGWEISFADNVSNEKLWFNLCYIGKALHPDEYLSPEDMFSLIYYEAMEDELMPALIDIPLEVYGMWMVWDIDLSQTEEVSLTRQLDFSFYNVSEYYVYKSLSTEIRERSFSFSNDHTQAKESVTTSEFQIDEEGYVYWAPLGTPEPIKIGYPNKEQ